MILSNLVYPIDNIVGTIIGRLPTRFMKCRIGLAQSTLSHTNKDTLLMWYLHRQHKIQNETRNFGREASKTNLFDLFKITDNLICK